LQALSLSCSASIYPFVFAAYGNSLYRLPARRSEVLNKLRGGKVFTKFFSFSGHAAQLSSIADGL
jgi:hypothetical protein